MTRGVGWCEVKEKKSTEEVDDFNIVIKKLRTKIMGKFLIF